MKEEMQTIRKTFIKADYPRPFVNSVINQYKDKTKEQQIDNEDDYIIPPYLFVDEKTLVLLKLSFCEQNELKSKDFIKEFHELTSKNFRFAISWKTRKIKSLFKINDKNLFPACKIYYRKCEICGNNYIREQCEIQSPVGRDIIILITSQNRLNTLKEILIMYSNGRFYALSFTETSYEELRSNFYNIL